MSLSSSEQLLASEFTDIIARTNPKRDPEEVRRLVEMKVAQLTAQEPFFLNSVLGNDELSDFEKAGAFTALRHNATGEERYPEDYHMWLKKNTH